MAIESQPITKTAKPKRISQEASNLFEQIQQDLNFSSSDYPGDVMLCPLCLGPFRKEDLEGPNAPLTVEHILPGKIGGKWKTLTCKKCNNEQGAAIDEQFIRRIRAHNAIDGDFSPLIAKIDFEGHKIAVTYRTKRDREQPYVEMNVIGGPPETLARFAERMKEGTIEQINFSLSFNYIEDRSRLAMIRVAYLIMFDKLGYKYILSEALSVIRDLLSGKIPLEGQEVTKIADQLASWNITKTHVDDSVDNFIMSLAFDNQLSGYMVVFKVDEGKTRYFSVLMPPADMKAEDVIPQMHALSDMVSGKDMRITLNLPSANWHESEPTQGQ